MFKMTCGLLNDTKSMVVRKYHDADFSELDLTGYNFRASAFYNCVFNETNFAGADFSYAAFGRGCVFYNTDFRKARMSYCAFADLKYTENIKGIYAEKALMDQKFLWDILAYRDEKGIRITAGCRDFTLDQAVTHWGEKQKTHSFQHPKYHKIMLETAKKLAAKLICDGD